MILPFTKHIESENAPWLILINGLFTDQKSWTKALDDLSGFNILTYDGRGQGEGPLLEKAYELNQQVSDLYNIISETKLTKVNLLGLSNGGRVALKFSSLHAKFVDKLVVCDSYGNLDPLIKIKLESWQKAHRKGGNELRFDVSIPWVWGESFLSRSPELVEYYREKSLKALDGNIEGLLKGALTGTVDLSKIKANTLFVVGEEDLLTPPSSHHRLAKQVENSRVEVVPGGHASIIENPESIKKVILPFLLESHELG
jgi:3-oxoadipate enol-lactonase